LIASKGRINHCGIGELSFRNASRCQYPLGGVDGCCARSGTVVHITDGGSDIESAAGAAATAVFPKNTGILQRQFDRI
jgi:hypothetical protein